MSVSEGSWSSLGTCYCLSGWDVAACVSVVTNDAELLSCRLRAIVLLGKVFLKPLQTLEGQTFFVFGCEPYSV